MLDLNKVGHVHCHIVTKVVETELVVGSESDRTVIGPLSGVAVRLMLVDAVHRKTVEHVERTHPLGVTLGEVVVDGDDMHTLARQGVKEHRKCRHKSLALTGSHLGDLSLMKHNTTDQLNIIVNHVPSHLVAAGDPMVLVDSLVSLDVDKIMIDAERPVEIVGRNLDGRVLLEPAGRRLHDGESLGKHLIQNPFDLGVLILHQFVGLGRETFLLVYGDVLLHLGLDLRDPLLKRSLTVTESGFQFFRLCPKFVISKLVNRTVGLQNLVQNRPDLLKIPIGLRAENLL